LEAKYIFSLDTNFIIALLNQKDRLHPISKKIIIEKKDEPCGLCSCALKETIKVYRNKLNNAISKLFPLIWKIKDIDNSFERNSIILEEIKELIKKEPNLSNFYELLHNKIVTYIEKVGIDTLPHYLSNFSENTARTIHKQLHTTLDFTLLSIKNEIISSIDKYDKIKNTIASIHFKDHTDYDIFLELIMNVSIDITIDFFTNDREFKIKGEHAYLLLVEKVSFDDTWFHISYRTN